MDDKNEQMLLVARKTGDKEERRVLNGRAPESVVADFLSGPPGYEPYQDTGMELQVCPVTTASTLCAVMRGELAPRALVGIVDVREVDQPSARYGVFVYLKPLARGSSGNTVSGPSLTTPAGSSVEVVATSSGPVKRKHLPYYKDVPAAAAEYIPRNSKGYFVLITEAQTGWSTSGYTDRDGEQLSADQCAMGGGLTPSQRASSCSSTWRPTRRQSCARRSPGWCLTSIAATGATRPTGMPMLPTAPPGSPTTPALRA